MHLEQLLFLCLVILPTGVICQQSKDVGCVSPDSLLNGRRSIVSAVFRASNDINNHSASQVRLSDDGWCSDHLATDIFDPYIEIDFGRDILFTSVTIEGIDFLSGDHFIKRFRIQIAAKKGASLQYIALSANNSQLEPAIFPLGQNRINNTKRHRESLPKPVIGQILRINPYEWNDDDHVCTRLEVYGCPLQECQYESHPGVDCVTVNGSLINYDNLFNFNNTERYYCGPTNMRPFTMTITYCSPVLLREIGIHGRDRTFPLSNQYVTNFSMSFSEDGDNFIEYIRDTGSTEFTVSDHTEHYFGLWPPITASSIKLTINDWDGQPCMSLLMVGCNYSNVVNHSNDIVDPNMIDDSTLMFTITELTTIRETITESFTIYRTVINDLNCTPNPSPLQDTGSVTQDKNNTPIFIATSVVVVGLLLTLAIFIVGVILCHRHQKRKKSWIFSTREESDSTHGVRMGLGITKQDDVQSKLVSKNPMSRVEAINLQYDTIGDQDHVISNIPTQNKNGHSVDENNNAVIMIASNNDPATEDNPAYSQSVNSGPPLIDNPAYSAMKDGILQ